jgi:hypothetical protein
MQKQRRELLKRVGIAAPTIWVTPVVMSVALPAHAQTSSTVYELCDIGPGGGIVFQISNGGLNGLEAAPSDQPISAWGCDGTDVAGATSTAIGTGSANTDAILAAGCLVEDDAANSARNYTGGGFTDWFLPSQDELNEMYTVLNLANPPKGDFHNGVFWSSTQVDSGEAMAQFFSDGSQVSFTKPNAIGVRAVRAF